MAETDSQAASPFAGKGCPYCGSDRFEVQIRLGSGGQMDSSGVQVTCKQCGRQLTLGELKLKQEPAKVAEKKPAESAAPVVTESKTAAGRTETAHTTSGATMELSMGNDALLEAGRVDVYRVNAFRVTQLPVDATTREIARQTEKLRVLEKLGGVAGAGSGPLRLEPQPDQHAMREALQRLRDPERRLVDELFWFWPQQLGQGQRDESLAALGRGDVMGAARGWLQQEREGSESNVSMHNLAVLSHAMALDLEHTQRRGELEEAARKERDRCWPQALKRWRTLLEHEGFWSRLTARIRELDDPRLTTGTVRRMRASLPLALLTINAQLAVQAAEAGQSGEAQRHAEILRESGFATAVVEEALRRALEPVRDRIQTLCKAAEAEGDKDVEHADRVARRLQQQAGPLLEVMDRLLPAGNPMRDGVHDEVALRALGCQIQHGNKTENWKTSKDLLEMTLPMAASESAKGRIQDNLRIVTANLESQQMFGTCFFCKQNKADDAVGIEVKMHGEVVRTPTFQGTRITWKHGSIKVPRCGECRVAHDSQIKWVAWYLFAFFLYWIAVPISLIRFIPRFKRNPTPPMGRFLGFCTGVLFTAIFGIVMSMNVSPNRAKPSTAEIIIQIGLFAAVWVGAIVGGGWYGKYLRQQRGLPEDYETRKTRPEKDKNEFPPIQDRLRQGWQFGEQPATG